MRRSTLFTRLLAGIPLLWSLGTMAQGGTTCGTAQVITPGAQTTNAITGTYEAGAESGCFGSAPAAAMWFTWTPPNNGTAQVTSCGSGIDTQVSVASGTCGGPYSVVACNDDDAGGCGGFASDTEIFNVVGGTQYYIQWGDGWSTSGFAWNLSYTAILCTSPTANPAVVVPSCGTNQYSVNITVTSFGDATSLTVTDGTTPQQIFSPQTVVMGPYASGSSQTYSVIHDQDNACSLTNYSSTNYTCPLIINSYPYCQNFEGLTNCLPANCTSVLACTNTVFNTVGWVQDGTDTGQWSLDNGGTVSGSTGICSSTSACPDFNPGTSLGKYVYLETSGACTNGPTAILLSPEFDVSTFTNGARAQMAYSMYGAAMGTMRVDVEDPSGSNSWNTLWTLSGDQGQGWFQTPQLDYVPTGTAIRYRVVGISGSSFTSDMAFDYFCVSEAPLCMAPSASASVDATACPSFNVDVNVSALGDATDVNISYTVNGGTPVVIGPFGTGTQILGPFTNPDVVNVTVVHNGDAACNVSLGNFTGPTLCNDICSGAIAITCASSPVSGTSIGSTQETIANCGAGNAGPQQGVWYSYVGDDQQVTLNTCATPGYDTRLTVFEGSCGSLVCVTGNDDMGASCAISTLRSQVQWNANLGTTYYIMVHAFGAATTGNFVLNLTCAPLCVPVPANDDCAFAEVLTVGSGCVFTPGTTNCSNPTAGNPTCISGFATANDVYYSFTAGGTDQIATIDNITATNLGVALYTACGGTQLFCTANATAGADIIWSGLTIGNVYVARVFSLVGQTGDFDICVRNACVAPTVTVTPTYYNCASATPGATDISVDITAMGSDPDVDIVINAVTVATGVGVGIYGPYSYGSGVSVDVDIITDDTFCDQSFGTFTNSSVCITCDTPPLAQNYCYGAPSGSAGSNSWLYESDGLGSNFSLTFQSGTIESSTFDNLAIYDGTSNADPILYQHAGGTISLAGVTAAATGTNLYMEASWDASVSCASGSFAGDPWNWTVACLSCDLVDGVVLATNTDCLTSTYTVDVQVTDLGDAPDVTLFSNLLGGEYIDQPLGTYTMGPYPSGTPVNITIIHNGNNACNKVFAPVNPTSNCIACDNSVLNQNYCYGPNEDPNVTNWSYTSDGAGTLVLVFNAGTVESSTFDQLTIYDGSSNAATPLYQNVGTENLAGLTVIAGDAGGPGNALYMDISSDASVQCSTNPAWEWFWDVQCVDCTFPEATGTIVENCGAGTFTVDVNITDASNAGQANIIYDDGGGPITVGPFGTGVQNIGPFPNGTVLVVSVAHPTNAFCTSDVGTYTDCCSGSCATAIPAVVGVNTTSAVDCGTPSNALANGASPATGARWFSYTLPADGQLFINACNPPNTGVAPTGSDDTFLTVHEGTCAALVPYGGDDDACVAPGFGSVYTMAGYAGETYYFEWDDRWNVNGFDWELGFTPAVLPANDLCSLLGAAPTIAVGGSLTFNGNRDNATKDGGINNILAWNGVSDASGWVWESFELTECAQVILDYCGSAATGIAFQNMYADCGNTFINSATGEFTTCAPNLTLNMGDLVPGTYYYPVIWHIVAGAVGPYTINVNATAPSVVCPTNLTACTAEALTCPGQAIASTDNIFPSLPAGGCAFSTATSGGSLWYSFTAGGTNENVTLSTCGVNTLFDTRLSVYSGPDCNTLSCYTLGDDKGGACGTGTQIEFTALAGETYLIAVHSTSGFQSGQFELNIACSAECPRPSNDNCSGATGLTSYLDDGVSPIPTAGDNTCAMNDQFTSCQPLLNNQGMWYEFNTGANTIHLLDLEAFDQSGTPGDASVLNYSLFSGACNSTLGAGGGSFCTLDADGYDVLLTGLTTSTDYLLYIFNQGDIGFEGTFNVTVMHPGLNDAGISDVADPEPGLLCTSDITPEVTLTNFGENTLTSVDIHYDMSGLNPQVFNWTGSLAYGTSETVILPTFTSPYGVQTFNAYTQNPNGVADDIPTNDLTSVAGVDVTGETVILEITTDNDPSGLFWEIYDASSAVVASSDAFGIPDGPVGGYVPNSTQPVTLCLTTINGNNFTMYLFDFLGDGLSGTGNGNGKWRLRTAGGGTILGSDFDGTIDGLSVPTFSPQTSTFANGSYFDLPVGPAFIEPSECNVFTNNLQNKVYCHAVSGISQYMFEFSRPDNGFARRIAVPRNWVRFSEMQTFPLLPGLKYFARVRIDDGSGFANNPWSTGCEMGLDPNQVPGCTSLYDSPGAPAHSCDVVKVFGGSDKIFATPVVTATQYRFKFEGVTAGTTTLRIITRPSYACVLNWVTLPLTNGVYNVSVEALVGGQWSGYCGPVCPLTIATPPSAFAGRGSIDDASSALQAWPNPVRDGQVNLLLEGLTDQTQRITVEVYDMFGKRIMSNTQDNSGEVFNTILELDGVASGIYLVNVTVNGEVHQQRISVL